jgi:hypothetical protein
VTRRRLPEIGTTWAAVGGYDPDRRVKVVGYRPEGKPRPSGVVVRVVTSVRPDRLTMMALKDFADSYRQEP